MTHAAITRNRVTIAALLVIALFGMAAYFSLPQDEDPGFIIRVATVITRFPGAGPERVENLVTDKIEKVVQEIPELDFVSSESRTGVSIVFVNVQQRYKDMRPIWDNLRRKIDGVRSELPDGVIGPQVNDEFGDVFGILLSLTGDGFSYAELKQVADEIREEILLLPDAAKVEIYGAQDERVFVEYNNARLAELSLSAQQLEQILESQNIVMPGGDVRIGPERVALEPTGSFETIEDIGETVIRLPGRKDVVYLRDVATVRRGYIDPPRSMVRVSGVEGLSLGVSLRTGGNILDLGRQVDSVVERLELGYPWGIEIDRVADQPGRVEKKVDEFVRSLVQAMAIVLLVMLVTLGIRTGLVVASLIPMAMLMTLIVMRFLGIGLNQMTLAALIIALGMLIDNAIVMSESIMVQMRAGRSAFQSAIDSGAELRVPLLTSSLTTSAAFLPFYLAKSQAGEYTGVIFSVVTITLLCSWILALTMTPLLCVGFLRVKQVDDAAAFRGRFYSIYRATLILILKHRALAMLGIAALFLAALVGLGQLPALFFPKADRTFFSVKIELPTGTDIEVTRHVVQEIEGLLSSERVSSTESREGVTNWLTFIGGGEPRYILNTNPEQANPSYAYMLVNTSTYPVVRTMISQLQSFCDERFFDVVATINPSDFGPPVEKPIQVRISGRDPDQLFRLVEDVKDRLRGIEGTRNIGDNWGRRTKKLVVQIDQPRARRAGVTSLDIAISLQSLLSGVQTTEFRESDEIIPVVLRQEEAGRQDLGKLETLAVYSQATGRSVPLKQVADVKIAWQDSKIRRRNRLKTITAESDLVAGMTAAEVNAILVPWLDEQQAGWPRGYRYELGGEIESSIEANESIKEQLPVAGLIIVLLLVSQFNSFRKPVIILATIPLALIGVVPGLALLGSYFGFMTLLGIVSLAGIVINNAIVLLDRIQFEITENDQPEARAIIEAAQRRFRPILLTTLTTIGGLLPLYLGGGPMWEPMAITIMFGLLFATLLTLGFVPVAYSLFYRVSFKGFQYDA